MNTEFSFARAEAGSQSGSLFDGAGRRAALLTAASAVVLAAAGFAGPARAQETGEGELLGTVEVEGEAESYRAEELDDERRPASLLETPNSVSVITQQVIEDTAATSLAEALRTVPGITMAMGEGGQPFSDRPFLRGFESTSGLLVDGLRDTGSQSRDIFNMESVEVQKGPGGAYGGRGGPGGTINLVTKSPRAGDFVNMTGRIGDPGYARAIVDANQMLTDLVGVRAVVMWQDAEVAGREAVYDDRWGFAPSVTIGLDRPTQLTASFVHYESEGLVDYGHPLEPNTGQDARGPLQGLDRENYYGLANRDHMINEEDSATLEISHDFGNGVRLSNITRYADTLNDYIASNPDDSQGNIPNGLVVRNVKSRYIGVETLVNQTNLSAVFDTGMLRHTVSVGGEISHEESDVTNWSVEQVAADGESIPRGGCDIYGAGAPSGYNCTDLYNPNPYDPWSGAISLNTPGTQTEVDTIGLYLFDNVQIGSQWSLNLGLRWDDYDTEANGSGFGGPFTASNKSDFLSYQAGVTYQPVPGGAIYASFGSSSSPSGVTAGAGGENLSTSNEDLEPQKSYNYEVGTKWELFDGRLLATAAVFRTEQQDAHVSAGRGSPQEAIGESRVQGLELSASGQITDAWSLFAGYSYQDSEVIEDANGSTVGNMLPNAPEHSFTLWTTYQVTPAFSIGGGARYQDLRYGNTSNSTFVPDYWVADAFAEYQVLDNLSLQLNVNNLFDETYYERVYTTHMATVGAGRQILLTGTANF